MSTCKVTFECMSDLNMPFVADFSMSRVFVFRLMNQSLVGLAGHVNESACSAGTESPESQVVPESCGQLTPKGVCLSNIRDTARGKKDETNLIQKPVSFTFRGSFSQLTHLIPVNVRVS